MTDSIMYNKKIRWAWVLIFWLLIWEGAYLAVGKELIAPPPASTALSFFRMLREPPFYFSVGMSLLRIVSGYAAGVLSGALLAVLTFRVKAARHLLSPALDIIKATPVASFIIITLVWLQSGQVPVFTSMIMVLPIVWSNVSAGIQKVDGKLLDVAKVFRFKRSKTLKTIYIPSVMPYFRAAATTSMGLAWKAGIAAEVLATPKFSIGGLIYSSKIYLETADLFAQTAGIILLSVLLEKLLVAILGKDGKSRAH